MYFRKSRFRFIAIRCGLFGFIFLFVYKIERSIRIDDKSDESLFWKEIRRQDRYLTNQQRIQRIQSIRKTTNREDLNWTKIFNEIYQNKLAKRAKHLYKQIFYDKEENFTQNTFQIFEETPVFQRPKFCSSSRIFHPQCPFTNCQWTCQKSSFNSDNIHQANVFHHVDINLTKLDTKLQLRSTNDIWILWIDEANCQLEHLNKYLFNWTISFRQDSEISIGTYGLLIPKSPESTFTSNNQSDFVLSSDFLYILTNRSILITDLHVEHRILTNYRFRSKHALWFVSNCQPKSRLKYYKQLKKYYPIHAYGSCVNKHSTSCDKTTKCESNEWHSAMFYLAFESQTCKDYITEKFWRALHYGMIPIVFGPNKRSYLDLGIPSSAFIHVDDFQDAKQLSKYLHRLANDYFLYRTYFQWLNQYEIFFETNDLEPIRMCELCMRLNMQDKYEHRFYENIHRWHRTDC